MSVDPRRRLFTVDEFERMVETGILSPDDKVELLDGEVVEMTPIGPPHVAVVTRAAHLLVTLLGDRTIVRVQAPVRVSDTSMPEPDIAVVIPEAGYYANRHPESQEILWLIEVSRTSVAHDRTLKAHIYARGDIRELWVAALPDTLEVFRDPSPAGYRSIRTLRRGDVVRPEAVPDVEVRIEDILGH